LARHGVRVRGRQQWRGDGGADNSAVRPPGALRAMVHAVGVPADPIRVGHDVRVRHLLLGAQVGSGLRPARHRHAHLLQGPWQQRGRPRGAAQGGGPAVGRHYWKLAFFCLYENTQKNVNTVRKIFF